MIAAILFLLACKSTTFEEDTGDLPPQTSGIQVYNCSYKTDSTIRAPIKSITILYKIWDTNYLLQNDLDYSNIQKVTDVLASVTDASDATYMLDESNDNYWLIFFEYVPINTLYPIQLAHEDVRAIGELYYASGRYSTDTLEYSLSLPECRHGG